MNASEERPVKTPVQFHLVTDRDEGQRLDNCLFRLLKNVPKTRIYRLLRKGEVRVNKKRVDADYRLILNDEIRIPPLIQEEPVLKNLSLI
ncbi:MAG: S4 domain-containing protein [Gammaproteobacteria bacterium]|nr:S4 domain-containing protein [Gammaproteobacteria bacterium]